MKQYAQKWGILLCLKIRLLRLKIAMRIPEPVRSAGGAVGRGLRLGDMDGFRKQEVYALAMAAAVLAVSLSALSLFERAPESLAKGNEPASSPEAAPFVSPFDGVRIGAKSAIVWDVRGKRALFERYPDQRLPLASLTKVMTAITAIDIAPRQTVVRILPEFLAEEGDSGLYADENWRLKDLIDYSLVVSSNDGARAIAAVAGSAARHGEAGSAAGEEFVRRMNAKARSIGLTKTVFHNETGLDLTDQTSGGYGSARDMAKLFEYAIRNYPDVMEATRYGRISVGSIDGYVHVGENTNVELDLIPGVIASKTGYTSMSGGNLVVAFDAGPNRPIVVAVLGSTYDGRFSDVGELARAALEHLAREGERLPATLSES